VRPRHNWQRIVLERLDRKIKKDGVLTVLKKGLSVDDTHLRLLCRLPYNTKTPEVTRLFEANIFSVTRQVYFLTTDSNPSVDNRPS
jgi:type I restriction enzyme R subunit